MHYFCFYYQYFLKCTAGHYTDIVRSPQSPQSPPFFRCKYFPFFIYLLYSKETEDDVLMFSKKIMQCLGQKEMLNTLTYAYVHPLAFEKKKKHRTASSIWEINISLLINLN